MRKLSLACDSAAFGGPLCSFCDRFATPARYLTPSSDASTASPRRSTIASIWPASTTKGGARRMWSQRAADRPAHRIDHEAPRHRLALEPRVEPEGRVERLFGHAVFDELERAEEAAAADVADEGAVSEPLHEAALEKVAHGDDVGQQVVAPDHVLHGDRRRGRHRMAH